MATTSVLVDDFNGESPASVISFTVASQEFEIDLTEANAKSLDTAIRNITKFLDVARPARVKRRVTEFSQLSDEDKAAVRAFHHVGPRSRPGPEAIAAWRQAIIEHPEPADEKAG